MEINCCQKEDTLTVGLSGEIDHHVTEQLREVIDQELSGMQTRHLVFDFSGVMFMDSSGIGMVLGRYKKIRKQGGTVTIRGANRLVRQILELSGVFLLPGCTEVAEEDGAGGR